MACRCAGIYFHRSSSISDVDHSWSIAPSELMSGWVGGRAVGKEIFISHSSRDIKKAQAICKALEARGRFCWMSSRDINPGDNYQGSIVRAIREAPVMVLVFSANANRSDEIKKELSLASQLKRIVIPARIEDVEPNTDLQYELATRQWIDLYDDWDNSLDRLERQIDHVLPRQSSAQGNLAGQGNSNSSNSVTRGGDVSGSSFGAWFLSVAIFLLALFTLFL